MFTEKDAQLFFKAVDYSEDKNSKLNFKSDYFYQNFYYRAKCHLQNENLADYATLYFIKEIIRSSNHIYLTFEETVFYFNLEHVAY